MTQRYFYTDPLAAAWMAKHFGMKFGLNHYGKMVWEPVHFSHKPGSEPFTDVDDILEVASPLYIHPDSLHLLTPQIGDLCMGDKIAATVAVLTDHNKSLMVIRRNGVPFHWPEVEPA
jgi:hypothetical protein